MQVVVVRPAAPTAPRPRPRRTGGADEEVGRVGEGYNNTSTLRNESALLAGALSGPTAVLAPLGVPGMTQRLSVPCSTRHTRPEPARTPPNRR
jgi:hypothetical protein